MKRVFAAFLFVAGCVLGVSAFNIVDSLIGGIAFLCLSLMICSFGVAFWTGKL